jgi:hypothetical protein
MISSSEIRRRIADFLSAKQDGQRRARILLEKRPLLTTIHMKSRLRGTSPSGLTSPRVIYFRKIRVSKKPAKENTMTGRIKGNLWLLLLITAVGLSAVGFAASGVMRRAKTSGAPVEMRQSQSNAARSRTKHYVNRGLVSPRLASNLNALGNRLERPGKERLTLMGSLRTGGETREVAATLEFPDKLRLAVNGPHSRVIAFDGEQTKVSAAAGELDLIETLAYDSAEHFFAARMQGKAMRFLGARFRTDDGSSPNYTGPYFDIYKIADQVQASGQERPAKLYHFNSDTLLLERVTYVINRGGAEISVETKLSDWRGAEGQQVARRIERFENGNSVFVLSVRSVHFGGRADDGLFVQ